MAQRGIESTLVTLALAALIATAGCAGDDDSSDRAGDSAKTTTTSGSEEPAKVERARRIAAAKRRKAAATTQGKNRKREAKAERARAARETRREDAQDRKQDREFDEAFDETAFDKLVDKLPVRKPPLYVEQYITDGKTHKLYTAVGPKRFCALSAKQRERAVERFYRAAERLMSSGGVKDFVQVVTLTAETVEQLPALAIGRRGSVSLTKRGKRSC